MGENLIRENERLDDLMIGNLWIIQNPKLFCFGMDAVLLSSFARVHDGEKALDLCCGNGIIPLLLYGKTKGRSFDGLELQPQQVELATRSVRYNHLEDIISIKEGDIRNYKEVIDPGSYEVITANPPYMKGESGLANASEPVTIARHEKTLNFEELARAAAYGLKVKGRFYLVHRPNRLVEILSTLSAAGLEPKRMRLVMPYRDKEPNLVLIESKKGASPELRVEPPLVIYNSPGKYTEELLEMYGLDRQD